MNEKVVPHDSTAAGFLDALASLKTMLDIHSVADVFKISRLQSIRE